MEHVQALIQHYFAAPNGELLLGDIPIRALSAEYGTPLFVYDRKVLEHKWALLQQALPAEFRVYYSTKANPHPALLQYFLGKGCGLEIASGGEFSQAMRAGCAAEDIVFAGPGKTEAELELVLRHGIGEIHAESLREIERISQISRRLGIQAHVAVRVNPTTEAQGGAMRMGGKPAPFGIDEEQLDPVLDRIVSDEALTFQGIHLFSGTQILDHGVLLDQYRKGIQIARRVAERLQQPLKTVDFGGGLGIPYFANERALDMARLGQGLTALMDEVKAERLLADTQFVIEPGRYLVGEAGVYVAQVLDIKVSRGKKFVIIDGGMHHHLAASGNLGQTIKRNFPLAVLNKIGLPTEETVDVVGPLCTPLDVLGRGVELPQTEVGDLIGIFQSGAYARTASPLGFLSHPSPPEVWVDQGVAHLIRGRGREDEYLRDVLLPYNPEYFSIQDYQGGTPNLSL